MFGLQETFEKTVSEFSEPKNILLCVLNKRFEQLGIPLTTTQQDKLAKAILEFKESPINFEFEDGQIANAGFRSEDEIMPLIQSIFDNLTDDVDKYADNFEDQITEILQDTITDSAPSILSNLKNASEEVLSEQRLEREQFSVNLSAAWGEALDLLELFLVISFEAGDYTNNTYRPMAATDNDFTFDVLTRLHARSCQVSWEIITLLNSGFADGAHARWRSLHEVSVVATLIADGNSELAERYLLHEGIESFKAAIQYKEHSEQLGFEKIQDSEIDELTQHRTQLINRFGSDYKNDYGWASDTLGKARPTFRDIESAVNLDYLRPFYKMASQNVHATPKSVLYRLGMLNDTDGLLLAGPSNVGLTDPGQLMALSLLQVTSALLAHAPSVDTILIITMLTQLSTEVGEALIVADKAIADNSGT